MSSTSELRDLVLRYTTDRRALLRRWDVEYSRARRDRMRAFYEAWTVRLRELDVESLGVEGRIDLEGKLETVLAEFTESTFLPKPSLQGKQTSIDELSITWRERPRTRILVYRCERGDWAVRAIDFGFISQRYSRNIRRGWLVCS